VAQRALTFSLLQYACDGSSSALIASDCSVGSSADLVAGDCDAWRNFNFTQDRLYKEWAEGKCGAKVRTDPCSCVFSDKVGCTNGRIAAVDLEDMGVPSAGPRESAVRHAPHSPSLFLGLLT
jgi:hypothetical protein